MKRLNNKGLTLIEIIVSVSLIAVVMLFLYRLLGDVTYENDNEFFASKNQEQKIELIDYIETLMRKADISQAPTVTKNSNNTTIQFKQSTLSKTYTIAVYSNYIQIKDSSQVLRRWDIESGVYSYSKTECKRATTIEGQTNVYHPWLCTIPVYTVNDDNNANNNNSLDDIMLSFLARG